MAPSPAELASLLDSLGLPWPQTEQDFDRIEIEGATFETIVSRAAVEGLQCSGYDSNPSQRLELQGAPKFKGVCGPMWDGDAIRYECSATYAESSA